MSDIFAKLAAQEKEFLAQEFLAPSMKGKPIQVKISGIAMPIKIVEPKNYEGFGVFKAIDMKTAKFVRDATMPERRRYLNIFPACRLIVCAKKGETWLGIPANHADKRFNIEGLVPISLPQNIQLLQTVETRFDGYQCWYAAAVRNPDAVKKAKEMREALAELHDIDQLSNLKLRQEEADAYEFALLRALEERKDTDEDRIKRAIEKAGGKYTSYMERGDSFTIQYSVDGENHSSVVSKDSLEVRMAGICLSGQDQKFDLQSLVGVVREGIGKRRIVRGDYSNYGGGDPYDDPYYDED